MITSLCGPLGTLEDVLCRVQEEPPRLSTLEVIDLTLDEEGEYVTSSSVIDLSDRHHQHLYLFILWFTLIQVLKTTINQPMLTLIGPPPMMTKLMTSNPPLCKKVSRVYARTYCC